MAVKIAGRTATLKTYERAGSYLSISKASLEVLAKGGEGDSEKTNTFSFDTSRNRVKIASGAGITPDTSVSQYLLD